MENKQFKLGILGGLGPMSTVLFFQMVVEFTRAKRDQEHIDIIIANRASTPDRTEFIIGNSGDNPLDTLMPDARMLEGQGVDLIVIPCNTAHYFFEKIQECVSTPMLNMIDETMRYIKANKYKKVGILATTGAIKAGIFQQHCLRNQIEFHLPSESQQSVLMNTIYEQIKSGRLTNQRHGIDGIVADFHRNGCDCVILGCTELSLIKKELDLSYASLVDPLEILAIRTVIACGKPTNIGGRFSGILRGGNERQLKKAAD